MSMRQTSLALICPVLLALAGSPALAQEGDQPAESAEQAAAEGAEKAKEGAEAAKAGAEKAKEGAEKAEEGAEKAKEGAEAAAAAAQAAPAAGEAKAQEAAAAGEAKAQEAAADGEAKAQEAAADGEAKAEEAAADGEAKAEEAAASAADDAKAMMTAPASDGEIGVPWPSLYLGASVGGHFVLTPWDFGEIDGEGRPVSPESSLVGRLRIGYQAAEWLALEASVAHMAFKASTETNPGWIYDIDGLFFLKNADAWSGYVSAGVGIYHNAAPDLVDEEADINVHVGLGTKVRVAHWLWLRGDVRYYLGDSLDPDLPVANNIEAVMGLDLMLWGPDPKPKDTDGDGIIDPDDRCPTVPGQKETAGCPDRDRDGIVDAEDACPDAAGPAENKGCPDRDGDGILDKDDKCPDTPGVAEEQGCPLKIKDKDGDGIPDDKDLCPEKPEDMDGIEDANGCPEDDADQDGILDAVDKCPLKAETKNDFEEDDGCPDEKPTPKVVVTCERFELNESIYFDLAKFSIQARSFPILDQLAEALKSNTHVKRIRIEGHTDSQGKDSSNLTLSNNRAREVRKYLVNKGIAGKRLESKGYGETRPIATNDTEQGRAQNRRVDFVIVEQEKRQDCQEVEEIKGVKVEDGEVKTKAADGAKTKTP